jgi:hypothetical protein
MQPGARDEEWRVIPSAPAYEASSLGRIRRARDGHVMKQRLGRGGYLCVMLSTDAGRVFGTASRRICEAFHGASPTEAHQAAHDDGVRTNNAPGNLRWATCRENHADRRRHGTDPVGERNGRAKLRWDVIEVMKAQRTAGLSFARVAALHGVSKRQAMRVISGAQWGAP